MFTKCSINTGLKMSTYCVTFTIANKTIGGKTYDERRQRLIDNVREDDLGYWDRTTSFFLVESGLDTNSFAKRAFTGLSSEDVAVVFDPSDMSAASFGDVKDFDVLKSFLSPLTRYKAS